MSSEIETSQTTTTTTTTTTITPITATTPQNNNDNNGGLHPPPIDPEPPSSSSFYVVSLHTPDYSNSSSIHLPPSKLVSIGSELLRNLRIVFSLRNALDELRDPVFWNEAVVETVLCMYYECLIVWISVTLNTAIYTPNITHFGLYAGFFVFICIEGWSPICGASVNPARTWAFFLSGRMTFIKALVYTIVEAGGAAAGAMVGYGLTPAAQRAELVPIQPGSGLTAVEGMAVEAILTFNLIFVCLVLGEPNSKPSPLASLTIGFCVGTGVLAAGTHSGGLQNPIVAFGPAICTGNFTDHWLYWVGPYIGATIATAFYLFSQFVRKTYKKPSPAASIEDIQKVDEFSSSM